MKVGIIQPNYIPWRGYFDFIDDVDLFIFYDDVQFSRGDWRNRNKIKTPNGLIWLTVPVFFSLKERILIQNALIDYRTNWIKKHIGSIRGSYNRTTFFKLYAEEFFGIINKKYETISALNLDLVKWVMQKLAIKTEFKMSSEYSPAGEKTDRLIDILTKVGATVYLSGAAAKSYLEYEKFREAGIGLEFKSYKYKKYPQQFGIFEPYVSVLDLLFNCGDDSKMYIKSLQPNEKFL